MPMTKTKIELANVLTEYSQQVTFAENSKPFVISCIRFDGCLTTRLGNGQVRPPFILELLV